VVDTGPLVSEADLPDRHLAVGKFIMQGAYLTVYSGLKR
jgi:hypothetical protein